LSGVAKALLHPTRRHHPASKRGEVSDGMHDNLRMVGASLDAEVAAHEAKLKLIPAERRQVCQTGRPEPSRTKTSWYVEVE
jgi:hypothetical protein